MLLFSFTFSLFTLKLEAEKLAACQSYVSTSVVTSQGVVNILQLATDWLKLIVKGPRYKLHVTLGISPFSHGNYQGKSLLGLVNTPRRGSFTSQLKNKKVVSKLSGSHFRKILENKYEIEKQIIALKSNRMVVFS